jgi:5-methylcytosine-specific restriction endonuclease McrA
MAWAKSLVEIAVEDNEQPNKQLNSNDVVIPLEQVAKKVIKYYWNHTFFFELTQGSNLNKPPKIITLTRELIHSYNTLHDNVKPIRFERVEHNLLSLSEYDKTIKQIITVLKQDVSHRFLNLNGVVYENIYVYEKGSNDFIMKKENVRTLKSNDYFLFDIINYRWSLMLENYNSSPRVGKKVKITDEKFIQRKSLNRYFKLIEFDNTEKRCFICGRPIIGKPAIDHVIPWSYLYSDDLWNLVFVHDSCNSKKSDNVPNEEAIIRLEDRNRRLIKEFEETNHINKDYLELKLADEENLVRKFWIGCR